MADKDLWRSLAPSPSDFYFMNCPEASLLHNMAVTQFSFAQGSFVHRMMFPVIRLDGLMPYAANSR